MKNPCGTTRANVLESSEINGIPIFLGTGVNPVNSPAQFFVAWGQGVIVSSVVHTFSSMDKEKGLLWFIDEDEAEAKYEDLRNSFLHGK